MKFAAKLLALALAVAAASPVHAQLLLKSHSTSDARYAPDRLIVKLRDGGAPLRVRALADAHGATVFRPLTRTGLAVLRLSPPARVEEARERLARDPGVEWVEFDYYIHLDGRAAPDGVKNDTPVAVGTSRRVSRWAADPGDPSMLSRLPNDPLFSSLWGLHNLGQTIEGATGTADADIDAPEAWDLTRGSNQVVIAVIDGGVAYDHPDLRDNIWVNTDETLDGLDNDGNGYVDDVRGWDFASNDNDPWDPGGHGTHVAGTIAASGDNGIGITGVCWRARIMPVRFITAAGSGLESDAIAAIDYAVANGAQIINASWGGPDSVQALKEAIADARDAGVLFVAAAGNSNPGVNNDVSPHYPASFDLDNIIAVAASDPRDFLASFSHYGVTSVDIAAPGVSVLSAGLPAGSPLFSDDMESGGSNWSAGSPWTLITGPASTGTHSWTDSPGGDYQNNANASLTLARPLYLVGKHGTKLEFVLRLDTELDRDWLYVEGSRDGSLWFLLFGVSGSTAGQFERFDANLGDLDGAPQARFRFRLQSNGIITRDGVYIDDVVVTANDSAAATYSDTEYRFEDGTSMAAPHVSGVAGLVLALHPAFNYREVRDAVLYGADPKASLGGRVATSGRLNAFRALQVLPRLHFTWSEITTPQCKGAPVEVGIAASDTSFERAVDIFGCAGDTSGNHFHENWEDGNSTGWTVVTTFSGVAQVDSTTAAAFSKRSFSMRGSTFDNYAIRTLPGGRPRFIRFYVRANGTTRSTGYLFAGAGPSPSERAIEFVMGSNGRMGLFDGAQAHETTYVANRWYQVLLDLDWTTRSVKFYVDGTLVQASIPFRGSASSLTRLDLDGGSDSDARAWWDEIILDDCLPVVVSPSRTARFAHGVWTGNVIIHDEAAGVVLYADSSGHRGRSSEVEVVSSACDCRGAARSLDIADVQGPRGYAYPVPVLARGISGAAGTEFHIDFDPAVMSVDSVTSRHLVGADVGFAGNQFHVVWSPLSVSDSLTFADDDTLFTVWVTSSGPLSTASLLKWTGNNEIVNTAGDPVPGFLYCHGGVTVVEPLHDFAGRVVYYDGVRPVPDASVDLTGDDRRNVTTDPGGRFSFAELLPGRYRLCPSKSDGFSGPSVSDLVKIRRHLARLDTLPAQALFAADVDTFPGVSVADVRKITRYLVRLAPLPSGNWAFLGARDPVQNRHWSDAAGCQLATMEFSDLSDLDFVAFRMGDVNASWAPAGPGPMRAEPSEPLATLRLGDAYGRVGDTVALPVVLSGSGSAAGLEVHVGYDPAYLEFVGLSSPRMSGITVHRAADEIHAVWENIASPLSLAGAQSIASLEFRILASIRDSVRVDLAAAELSDTRGAPIGLSLHGGAVFDLSSYRPAAFELQPNRPNPMNLRTSFRAALPVPTEYALEIFTVTGQRVRSFAGRSGPGILEIVWDGRGEVSTVPPGVYFYRFRAGTFEQTRRLVRLN